MPNPSPGQKIVEVAVAKAAAEDAARRRASGAAPRPSRAGGDFLMAAIVVGVLILTLAIAIYAGR